MSAVHSTDIMPKFAEGRGASTPRAFDYGGDEPILSAALIRIRDVIDSDKWFYY